ncbi:MAG: PHP domain-containing protein [Armatimonadota bacterium]|nr:MAG: PHP domain-containing protein [Armatimonadota bacterium]
MNPSSIDLHVHTTASDGTLSPADAVREAIAGGVALLGIADHDTTDGIPPALEAAHEIGLTLIPGVELSVGSGKREIHVLGYFVDVANTALSRALAKLRGARDLRNERILQRLNDLGAPLDAARVQEIAGSGSVGRPHIAKALVEAGHVSSEGEAFGRYLARGKPAYVGRERLSPAEASRVIREAGGIPVLGHPAKIGPRQVIEGILDDGMGGIEVFHSDHDENDVALLMSIAQDRDLLITGGSDSHGPHSDRPLAIGEVDIPEWVGEQVMGRAPRWWREGR